MNEYWYLCLACFILLLLPFWYRGEQTGVNLTMWSDCILCMFQDLAMAGTRVGTVYSENSDLIEALDQLGCFHGVPGPTQHQVSQLLRDRGTALCVTFIYAP